MHKDTESKNLRTSHIFIVGYSLGANLITKYLGEEGLSGTLPKEVRAGLSLGNPLRINSRNLSLPWGVLLGAGIKRGVLLKHRYIMKEMRCATHQNLMHKALLAPTLGELDHHVSPLLIRNDSTYPFQTKIGFDGGQDYWDQASSSSYIQHVSIPLLVVMSKDDFLVRHVAEQYLPHCVNSNPNVIYVESETGGHLGWNAAMDNNPFGSNPFGSKPNWCDGLCAKFIESILWMDKHDKPKENYIDKANAFSSLEEDKLKSLSLPATAIKSKL